MKERKIPDKCGAKDDLIGQIEAARKKLNDSIDAKEDYNQIYQFSVELDQLIERYIEAGY